MCCKTLYILSFANAMSCRFYLACNQIDCLVVVADNHCFAVDVNECDEAHPLNDCQQRCINREPGFVNVQPGYVCDCDTGYRLAADGKNCTGKNTKSCPKQHEAKTDNGSLCIFNII